MRDADHQPAVMGVAGPNAGDLRYSGTHQLLHWLTAALMAAVIVLGWLMDTERAAGPVRAFAVWEWHKSLGLVVLAITVVRVVWRRFDRPPPRAAYHGRIEHLLARATHGALLLAMVWLPLTGYVYSSAAGAPPTLFNLIPTPAPFAPDPHLKDVAKLLHLGSRWVIYALILLHVAAVTQHVAVRRDRTLERMLPRPLDPA